MKKFLIYFMTMLLLSNFAISQEDWFAIEDDGIIEHHVGHPHHTGLFTGATSNLTNGHAAFTLGLDYTYFFLESDPLIGVGGFVDGVFGEHTEFIIGLPFVLQPFHEVNFFLAPSVLFLNLDNTEIDELHENDEIKFLLRFGGAYSFHFDNFSISPTISADVVGSQVNLVYGMSFGIGF